MNLRERGYFVTGTDTDVGKTRVTAAFAAHLHANGARPTIVKLVQTGLEAGVAGDAEIAGASAGVPALEFARFARPADPFSAARAEGKDPLRAADLAQRLGTLAPPVVAEGSGGVAVPLSERETLGEVARLCDLATLVVVGLRLGCINHAILTHEYLRARDVRVLGFVFVDRWSRSEPQYVREVRSALQNRAPILAFIPHDDAGQATAALFPFEAHDD